MLGFVLIFPILFLQRRGGLHFRGRGDRFHYEICRLGVAFESRYVVEDFLLTSAVSVSEALTFLQVEGLAVKGIFCLSTAGEEMTFCFCVHFVIVVSFVKGLDGVEFVLRVARRGNSAKRSSALIKKEWMIVIFARFLRHWSDE
jgi:hypothetical protein